MILNPKIANLSIVLLVHSTTRQGLAESPGVPSLEYLGIGYNAITGNPRGTESSNIDPGFRASVIKLVNDQNVLTVDTEYTVPLGTELRYITSCEYSDKSVQVSSSATYQRQLRETATSSSSVSKSGGSSRTSSSNFDIQAEVSVPIKGGNLEAGGGGGRTWGDSKGSDFSDEVFFSSSESYQKEVSLTQETELSAFESQGICAEFEAALKKYHKHELRESFVQGLATLPVPYNKKDIIHRRKYLDFISEYGTHYINRVTLGAKTVLTSVITQDKLKELESQDIDISTSFNFKSMKSEANGENDSFNVNANVGGSVGGVGGSVGGSGGNSVVINNYSNTTTETTQERQLSAKERSLQEISERLENTYEFNVGGLPAVGGNWKEWSRSVRENPMPISYDFIPLWSLVDDECAAKSLFDAIVDFYNLDKAGSVQTNPDVGSGIVRANSEPAVSYSETDIFGRYTYASGPFIRYSDSYRDSSLVTYNVTLQDTFKEATSPLFATMINGGIGPEGDEIDFNSVPFLRKIATTKNVTVVDKSFSPFSWRSKTVGEKLSLGILKFAPEGTNDTDVPEGTVLNSFSYISIPSLNSGKDMVVGVVNPDGTPVRKKSFVPLGYSVRKERYGTWKISFDNAFEEPPTLIAQPTWISSPENMPQSNAQVSLAVGACTTEECTVYLGSETSFEVSGNVQLDDTVNTFVNEHLGLSFLALDGNLTASSVLHGTVTPSTLTTSTYGDLNTALNTADTINTRGWTAKEFISDPIQHNVTIKSTSFHSNQTYTFVEITFETKFLETPTVIVTPILNQNAIAVSFPFKRLEKKPESYYLEKKSFASVEYITTSKALVKVGMVDSIGLGNNVSDAKLFESLPFSFLVVGPLDKKIVESEDDGDFDDLICSDMPSVSPSMSNMPSVSPSIYGKGKKVKGGKTKSSSPSSPPSKMSKSNLSTAPSPTPFTRPPLRANGARGESGASGLKTFMVMVGPPIFGLSLFMIM